MNTCKINKSIIQAVGVMCFEKHFSSWVLRKPVAWCGGVLVRPNYLNLFDIFTLCIMLEENFKQVQSSKSVDPIRFFNVIAKKRMSAQSKTERTQMFDFA